MQATMYSIMDLCCICLQYKNHLRRLSTIYENVNYYSRLTVLFTEMVSTVLFSQGAICKECCNKVDDFYKFRKQCLQNIQTYINYTSRLSSVSETSGEIRTNLTNIIKEQKELKNYDQFVSERSCTDILPAYDKTHCGTNETSKNSSAVETDRVEKEININDGTGSNVHPNNTRYCGIFKKEVYIKTEYEDTDEHEVETGIEHTAEWQNESRDPLETYGTTSTDDMAPYNYNTNIVIKKEMDFKSECIVDGEYKESQAGQDTDIETSSNSDDNCESTTTDMLKQTKTKSYECNICKKTFARSTYFFEHKRLHSEENPFKCEHCNKIFSHSVTLIRHKRTHTGDKPFKCDQCDKAFSLKNAFISHKRVHSGEKPFECDQCNKAFSQRNSLLSHIRIHSGEKPFKCDECDKSFTQSANLNHHKRTHSGEKPFKCEQCNKAFPQSIHLVRHKRIHSGEKPFKCEQCNKAFSQSISLIRHKRIHSGERPFKCEQCDKAFTDSSSFSRHKLTHSGERPFKCDQCNKSFSRSSSLIKHKQIHSG